MQCPLCQAENPPTAGICTKCSTPLPWNDPSLGATIAPGTLSGETTPNASYAWSMAVNPPQEGLSDQGEALVGLLLAERYEILELLGQGGMGAVYKARDTELERLVALKLIRPELASNPEILRRFKQELILAREVTHRNVIRIFDLGQSKGIKFITMEFVEGRDLRAMLRERGKIPPDESVQIIAQVCRALEAAHAAGVVHRDLKPQNIMLDAKDRVYVMDFGIAHSLETPGMTQTGALMGTPEYMSPEQAQGMKIDARSDLFALGIIFYELLTGVSPYKADTAIATLLKRTQERPQPPADVDPAIPRAISDVVVKCLEIDREHRYSTAREILEDLGHEMPTSVRTIAPTMLPPPTAPKPVEASLFQQYRIWIAGITALILLAGLGIVFRGRIFPGSAGTRSAPVQEAALAILPFRNTSGDASLDWLGPTLADMLSTEVGQSARVGIIPSDRLHEILTDQHVSANSDFDSDALRRVSESSSANLLVWGSYARQGDKILVDATVEDLKNNRRAPLKMEAASEKDLFGTVDQLSDSIRNNIGLGSSAMQEMKAAAYQPTSNSMTAIRNFNAGLDLARQGNQIEAVKQFEAAAQADPNFALAYSWLGQTYARLGHDQEAGRAGSKAMDLSANLSPVEKYMIQAANARIGNNNSKALDAYEKLAQLMPNDSQIQYQMGELYESLGAYDKAQDHYQKSLTTDPKQLDALRGLGQIETELGKPENAIDHLNRALSLAVQLNNKQGKAIVQHDLGEAYNVLNRPEDALQNFQQAFLENQEIGNKKDMATNLDQIAVTYNDMGKSTDAEKKYQEELALRKDIGDQDGQGLALINYGAMLFQNSRYEEALDTTKQALQIEMQVGNEPRQAMCLMNIGLIDFQMAKYDDTLVYQQRAVDLFQKLKKPYEMASNWNNLGLTYATMGDYDKALANYLPALDQARKVGDKEIISATLDDLAALYIIQGRYGEALKTQQEAVENAQQLQEQSGAFPAEIKADYAYVLIHLGRGPEAQKILDDSLKVSLSARSESLTAKTLNFQGQGFYYAGDFKSARPLLERAERSAAKAKDRVQSLNARLTLARVSILEGHADAAAASTKDLVKEANDLGLKYTVTDASITLGEAMLAAKDFAKARQELESALRKSEDLGIVSLQPRAHYLLSQALRHAGNGPEADLQLQKAAALVEQMRQESHSDTLLDRLDLKPIVSETRK